MICSSLKLHSTMLSFAPWNSSIQSVPGWFAQNPSYLSIEINRWRSSDPIEPATIFNPQGAAFLLPSFALYTNITHDARQGLLPETNSSLLVAHNVNTSLNRAIEVTTIISTCLSTYCETLPKCKNKHPPRCSATVLAINGSMLNAAAMKRCHESICSAHPGQFINTDIAGIGVVSSYIMQVTIVLFCGLALAGSTWFQWQGAKHRSPLSDTISLHARTALPGSDEYRILEKKLKDRYRGPQRLRDIIIVVLVEFLKAQCFFTIAIAVAALVILRSGDSTSLLDRVALRTAGGVGVVPVTANFYLLATFNPSRRSWYLYCLSLSTWTLGFCVTLISQRTSSNLWSNGSDRFFVDEQYPNACGNISPRFICDSALDSSWGSRNEKLYASCIPVMLGLTVWQISSSLCPPSFLALIRFVTTCNTWSEQSAAMRHTIYHISTMILLVPPLYTLIQGIMDLFDGDAVNGTWGFGQIVAVTVWIPTVAGFFNMWVEGVSAAHTEQLPASYLTIINNLTQGNRSASSQNQPEISVREERHSRVAPSISQQRD